jgi:hypothetical protein
MHQPNHRSAAVDNSFSSAHDEKSNDEVSDISEDEEYMAGEHGDAGHNVVSMKKFRVFWNQQKEEYLLKCFNFYKKTQSSDHGLKGKSWKRIALRMTQHFNEEYDSKSCRNKMNVLRTDYALYKEILEARQLGKDDEEFWAHLTAKAPRAIKFKDHPFPYYETLRRILEENGGNWSFFSFFSFFNFNGFISFHALFLFSWSGELALLRDPRSACQQPVTSSTT